MVLYFTQTCPLIYSYNFIGKRKIYKYTQTYIYTHTLILVILRMLQKYKPKYITP